MRKEIAWGAGEQGAAGGEKEDGEQMVWEKLRRKGKEIVSVSKGYELVPFHIRSETKVTIGIPF